MLSLIHGSKSRSLLNPLPFLTTYNCSNYNTSNRLQFCTCSSHVNRYVTPTTQSTSFYAINNLSAKDVTDSFKDWFKSRNNGLFDRIYQILHTQLNENVAACPSSHLASDKALSDLGLRITEALVLDVLKYGKDVLSCLKFFDWAGRQPGFYHTPATFNAIFKILSKAKLMSLMLDFLHVYQKQRYSHRVRFHDTLVMGYAVAGQPDVALHLFGRMRFQGLDLNAFAYHVLLNALVEENCFDAVEVIVKQIRMRNFVNEVTHSIITKSLCRQNRLDEAQTYLDGLVESGNALTGYEVSVLVSALCKKDQFEAAVKLMHKLQMMGPGPLQHAYSVWIRNLVLAGRLNSALEFFKEKKSLEGYVPDEFRYNMLIYRLLRETRLQELYDLLIEMKDGGTSPDKVTMNTVLCFFCKAGMVEVALMLYDSRDEFDLSPNSLAYNYLINTLCGEGSIDEACQILRNSIHQGYFPGKKTFSILADALCRSGKIDKMMELVMFSLERNRIPSAAMLDKFISALCKAGRVEDGYLLHAELSKIKKFTFRNTYYHLIHGFNRSNRGDIAVRLLFEMQDKGYFPNRLLYRAVIRCLLGTVVHEPKFFKLLEMQLSTYGSNCSIYNLFIDGVGHAKRPDLAWEVYGLMRKNGIEPNFQSDILILESYLKSERLSDALNFFNDVRSRRKVGRKLYQAMVVGLCRSKKACSANLALGFMKEMEERGVTPSIECYEVLMHLLCSEERYHDAVCLLNDYEKHRPQITSFIGNTLLFHSIRGSKLYDAWSNLRGGKTEYSTGSSLLGLLVGSFSGCIKVNQHIDNLEEVVENCFPLDTYTYNLLLRRFSLVDMDIAQELFQRMCQKGYEPNKWTYDILVRGFHKHGRQDEAKWWIQEMLRKGFLPMEQIAIET